MISFHLRRDAEHSVLSELRKNGHTPFDFPKHIPAREPSINAKKVQVTSHLTIDGAPILYIDEKGVFVEKSFFSDMKTVSVEQIPKLQHLVIGTVRKEVSWETLVRFLICSDVICTYVHIESQMQVVLENQKRAVVRGTHTYFTNEENTDSFAFVVEIDHTDTIHCIHLQT